MGSSSSSLAAAERTLLDWLRVEYASEKPNDKLLAVAELDSDTWVGEVKRIRGKKLPLTVTLRIARAFGLTLGKLIERPGDASAVTVIRANDHTYHYRSDKD